MNKPQSNPALLLLGATGPSIRASHSRLAAVMANQRDQVVKRLGQAEYETQSSEVRMILRELKAEFNLPLTVVAAAVLKSAAEVGGDTGLILASLSDELVASLEGV